MVNCFFSEQRLCCWRVTKGIGRPVKASFFKRILANLGYAMTCVCLFVCVSVCLLHDRQKQKSPN